MGGVNVIAIFIAKQSNKKFRNLSQFEPSSREPYASEDVRCSTFVTQNQKRSLGVLNRFKRCGNFF